MPWRDGTSTVRTAADLEALLVSYTDLLAFVAPVDPRLGTVGGTVTANQALTCRVVVPKTGTLRDLSVFVGTQSGNVDVGVYSTAATRARLYSSGSVACPASGWRIIGDPVLAVTAGDQLDFAVARDNATATILRYTMSSSVQNVLPTGFWATAGGAAPILCSVVSTAFPLPSTISEASMAGTTNLPLIIARIS